MRPSLGKSSLAVLRAVVALTQQQLAELAGCSRPTIQAVELGKLSLSRKLAEAISIQTGVSHKWLLDNKYRVKPVCNDDLNRPYTQQEFESRRADIERPRSSPIDVLFLRSMLADDFQRLGSILVQAYREDKTVHFHYKVRHFLEEMEKRFPLATKFQSQEPVGETMEKFCKQLEEIRMTKPSDSEASRP